MYTSCTWITTPEWIWACVILLIVIMIYSQVVTLKLPNGLLHQHTQKLLMKVSFFTQVFELNFCYTMSNILKELNEQVITYYLISTLNKKKHLELY